MGTDKNFYKELEQFAFMGKSGISLNDIWWQTNYEYWQTIFETGKTPQGFQVLAEPLDLMDMIKEY